MNYIKIIRSNSSIEGMEDEVNLFLATIHEKGHRVMKSHVKIEESAFTFTFVLNDEPHPHKKLKDRKENNRKENI